VLRYWLGLPEAEIAATLGISAGTVKSTAARGNGGICVGNCSSGFNGWIDHGRLVPPPPADGRLAAEAW